MTAKSRRQYARGDFGSYATTLDAKRPGKWITPAKLVGTDGERGVIGGFDKFNHRKAGTSTNSATAGSTKK